MTVGTIVPRTLVVLVEVTIARASFSSRGAKPLLVVMHRGELEPRDAHGEKERSRRTCCGRRCRSPPPLWSLCHSPDPANSWPNPPLSSCSHRHSPTKVVGSGELAGRRPREGGWRGEAGGHIQRHHGDSMPPLHHHHWDSLSPLANEGETNDAWPFHHCRL